MSAGEEVIVLMDNGSLRAGATLQLRAQAEAVGTRLGRKVWPVSLLHSSKLDSAELGGQAAQTLVPFLRAQRAEGNHRFTIIPMFFGPSGALVDYLPKRISDLKADGWGQLVLRVAPTMVQQGDIRVAEIMAELVKEKMTELAWSGASVAMCDHGSPAPAVNAVRELVSQQLQSLLGDARCCVTACSMERREGAEYDFNEPLLENLLGTPGYREKVIVSMLFAGPGRHAGAGGDVAQICEAAKKVNPKLETELTSLVGSKLEALSAILADRYLELSGRSD